MEAYFRFTRVWDFSLSNFIIILTLDTKTILMMLANPNGNLLQIATSIKLINGNAGQSIPQMQYIKSEVQGDWVIKFQRRACISGMR